MMKKTYTFYTLLLAVLCLGACKKGNNDIPDLGPGKDLVLNSLEQQQALTDNSFSLKLLKQVATASTTNKNLMLSPLSISMAIAMTSNGSNGATLEGIRNTLGFNGFTEEQINSYYQHLITDLPGLDPKATIKIANSIWYSNNFEVAPPFLQTNTNYYKAAVEALNFNDPASLTKINNWVNSQTNGKIPTIIEEIPANAIMYLINAVYFKSIWQYPFDKSKTAKSAFYISPTNTVQADFMNANTTFKMGNKADASVYELPYGNGKYSMVMVLPGADKTVNDLINSLDNARWNGWLSNLNTVTRDIKMPKFKFSYDITLNETLKSLGMATAFDENLADFTRINSKGGLYISKVKHKSFIEVNEEGTEAAAATSVEISFTSAPQSIIINRPFLFAIREFKSGLILFSGVVNNPLLTE
jgi:serine protease inhibitor